MFHIDNLENLLPNQPHNPQHSQEGKTSAKVEGGGGAVSLPQPAGNQAGG